MRRVIAALLKLVLWPIRVVLRVLGGIFVVLLRPVGRWVDESGALSNLLNQFSSLMATQRGLLLLVGIGLTVLSLLSHIVVLVIMVSSASFDRQLYWLCVPFILLHTGVLAGFVGAVLATPLGQGYKDK